MSDVRAVGGEPVACWPVVARGDTVGANVEEAQAGQSRADFLSKMSIACKEAREANYWLRLLASLEILPLSHSRGLLDESHELVAILTAIVKRTKANSEVEKK